MRRTLARLAVPLLLAGCGAAATDTVGSGGADTPTVTTSTQPGMPLDQRAVSDGDRVGGTVRVVARPGDVQACGDVPVPAVADAPGLEPAPFCPVGVDAEGVDLARLSNPRSKDGATEGWAYLEGVWRDDVLSVDRQDAPRDTSGPDDPDTVPCPEPAGGWPGEGPYGNLPDGQMQALNDYSTAHPEQQGWLALLRPGSGRLVLGVAVHGAGERATAERELRPALDDALCLVDAVTTRAQLAAVDADPALRVGPGAPAVYGSGNSIRDGVEPVHGVDTVLVTPALRAAADRHPARLVRFRTPLVRLG